MGKDGPDQAPESPIDPKTGAPVGIDKGWNYNVGEASKEETHKILENAIARLPKDIAKRLRAEIESYSGR